MPRVDYCLTQTVPFDQLSRLPRSSMVADTLHSLATTLVKPWNSPEDVPPPSLVKVSVRPLCEMLAVLPSTPPPAGHLVLHTHVPARFGRSEDADSPQPSSVSRFWWKAIWRSTSASCCSISGL